MYNSSLFAQGINGLRQKSGIRLQQERLISVDALSLNDCEKSIDSSVFSFLARAGARERYPAA
jgi:hypothetical protein